MSIASPCNGVCAVEPRTGLCMGCLRTMPEIIAWPTATDSERRAILEAVRRRGARPENPG